MSDADNEKFAALIEPVARELWGEPTKGTITNMGMRFGSSGSKSIVLKEGKWFDHEAYVGGNVIELVMHVENTDKAGALQWLEDKQFIGVRQPRQAAEGRAEPQTTTPPHEAAPEQPEAKAQRKGRYTVVKTYDYRSGDGELLYQVARIQWKLPDGSWELNPKTGKPEKTFRQRRLSGLPDGSWAWGLTAGEYMRRRQGDDFRAFAADLWAEWGGGERHAIATDISHGLYRLQEVEKAIEAGLPVHVVEGEKAVDAAFDIGIVATCNSGGANKFHTDLLRHFRGAHVVILPDNDPQAMKKMRRKVQVDGEEQVEQWEEPMWHPDGRPVRPGIDHAQMVAKKLRGIAGSVKIVELPGIPLKGDIVEWIAAGGDASKLDEIVKRTPDWRPPPPRSQMGAVGLDNLHRPDLHHDFVIDGFLDRRGVAMMPGASGSAKTFLVLELGMCIATERDFWGMKVKPGLVIYQAGEGKEGVTKRLDGWLQDRGVEPSAAIPFQMLPRKVNLFVDDKDTDMLIAEAKAWSEYYEQPIRLVVIDTFNKAITGANENAGQDMSKVLSRLERISESLDCAVLVPMHKSKQGDMRGHTSLTGDVSNVLNVTKLEIRDANGRQIRTVSLDKNKDGEGGRPMRFVLRQVVTGVDDEGKPITTCVVDRPDGDEASLVEEGKLSAPMTIFLDTLRIAIDVEGKEPADGVASAGRRVVDYTAFEARLRKRFTFKAGEHEPQVREKEFKAFLSDSGRRLIAAKYIDRDNSVGVIWWTGKSDRPWKTRKVAEPPPPLPASVRAELNDMDVPF